jgi:hypothetical protein
MSQLLLPGLREIENPFVVVCEGSGDARFVFELLKIRQIENCSVGFPNEMDSGGGGKDAIGRYVESIFTWFAIHAAVPLRGVLIVLDADDDPNSAFDLARKALQDTGLPAPGRAFSLERDEARAAASTAAAVYLVPGLMLNGEQETGTLEDILLRAAFEKNPQFQGCLDAFIGCIGKAPELKSNKKAKMRLSALVGASFPSNPWASVDKLLASSKNDLVPIDSIHFKHLADFLVEFCKE